VTEVRPGSPADDVGIKPGDAVIQVDRTEVTSPRKFYDTTWNALSRDSVVLVVVRRANAYRVTLEIE
jgi:serine protease Do